MKIFCKGDDVDPDMPASACAEHVSEWLLETILTHLRAAPPGFASLLLAIARPHQ